MVYLLLVSINELTLVARQAHRLLKYQVLMCPLFLDIFQIYFPIILGKLIERMYRAISLLLKARREYSFSYS